MKLPMKPDGKPVAEVEFHPAARLIARLDGLSVLREVYGVAAMREIVAAVDQRFLDFSVEDVRLRRADTGIYVIATGPLGPQELERIVQKLQAIVGDRPIPTSAGPAVATLSVGAVAGGAERRRSDLLRQAYAAAEIASARGPAGRCIPAAGEDARGKAIAIARSTLSALQGDRFALAYQPIIRADRTSIIAFNECLARVLEPSGRIVPAGAFIPAMEELRLTRPLDRRVLSLALAELAATPTLRLSINLSAQSLCDPGWLRILADGEAVSPGAAARLIVEITESAIIADEVRAHAFIADIRRFGCAIALDDFGAGFSAFRHLRRLRPDIIKIDGALVEGVAGDPDKRALIESIMVVARHFEMMTVAERVNDPQDSATLRRLGVDCFQGNSYGQPTIEPDWRAQEWIDQAAI